jgi:DDE family transposase
MQRSRRATIEQQQIRRRLGQSDVYTFFNVLTGPELFDPLEALLPAHRERLFPPTETLAMFLRQALSEDRSCQRVVNDTAIARAAGRLPQCSTRTGAYCRARQRLPTSLIASLTRHSGQHLTDRGPSAWRWRGRAVRLVDGTTVSMPDTAANQACYPQPRSQQPGLGFPLCRMAALICLGSGAILDAASSGYHGKGSDEQTLLRSMLDTLKRGEVLLGDAFYATYFLLAELHERGVDAVFEQHGARAQTTDFERGLSVGVRDHLLALPKPKLKPEWMTQAQYDNAPATVIVRELRAGGKTLITTMLCPKETPKDALKLLYRKRWNVELDLRNIKTTLGMETLSCRTPDMAIKEIWVYLLAYNLIRLIMAQAALAVGCLPRQLSFKHALQLYEAWQHHRFGEATDDPCLILFELMGQQRVANRPGRVEPRAIKRRPKPFPLMTRPRAVLREEIRLYGHPKKLK